MVLCHPLQNLLLCLEVTGQTVATGRIHQRYSRLHGMDVLTRIGEVLFSGPLKVALRFETGGDTFASREGQDIHRFVFIEIGAIQSFGFGIATLSRSSDSPA